ncbi:hypothetical protein Tco_0720753 [Tanacetum coccineum]
MGPTTQATATTRMEKLAEIRMQTLLAKTYLKVLFATFVQSPNIMGLSGKFTIKKVKENTNNVPLYGLSGLFWRHFPGDDGFCFGRYVLKPSMKCHTQRKTRMEFFQTKEKKKDADYT